VVVAAHEVGHAIQDQQAYRPLRTRARLVAMAARAEKVGAVLMMAVPVVALVTRIPSTGLLIFLGGLATLCIPLLVHLFTLPTEFDASYRRALPALKDGPLIPPEDFPAARRILTACALTYVAGALVGLLNVWRWIRVLRR
jgi:Zn-dependent membrane protease YugP